MRFLHVYKVKHLQNLADLPAKLGHSGETIQLSPVREAIEHKMKSNVLLVFAVLLLAVSFVPESEAFTAGGGGNIPRGAKREFQVSLQISCVSLILSSRELLVA